MTAISASLVKTLREKTGIGFMDCKQALIQSNGDLQVAVDWLRTKGILTATKKATRLASEGTIVLATEDHHGAIIELNSETDFVAQNDAFQSLAHQITHALLTYPSQDQPIDVPNLKLPEQGHTIAECITWLMTSIGENIILRRWQKLSVSQGVIGSYVHNAFAPYIGRIGVLVALESKAAPDDLKDLGKKLAMHIAASSPQAITIDDIDPLTLDRERTILTEQAEMSGKPSKIIDQIVEGRLTKFYQETVLHEQTYVIDGETKVKDVLAQHAQSLGTSISIREFVHFRLGDHPKDQEG